MTRTRELAHGLSDRERAIIDRHDAGAAIDAIAAELNLAMRYVRQVVQLYAITNHEETTWRRTAAASNAAFLAAIAACGEQNA